MARNRIIRPSFFDDEKISQVSRDARLLFIGMWKCSDDYGVVRGHPIWLKNNVFPYDDDIKRDDMVRWLSELEKIGVILPFQHSGEHYYYIKNFTKHQRIDKPSKVRNPKPPAEFLHRNDTFSSDSRDSSETSASVSREFRETSASAPRESGDEIEVEVEREIEIEEEVEIEEKGSKRARVNSPRNGRAGRVDLRKQLNFDPEWFAITYREEHGKLPPLKKFSSFRENLVLNFVAQHCRGPDDVRELLDQFRQAIQICNRTPFLHGDNKRKWKANFDWLLKDDNLLKVLEGHYDQEDDGLENLWEKVDELNGGAHDEEGI